MVIKMKAFNKGTCASSTCQALCLVLEMPWKEKPALSLLQWSYSSDIYIDQIIMQISVCKL